MTEFEKEVLRNGTSETRIMLWMSKAADFCDMCRLMTEQDIKGLKEVLKLMDLGRKGDSHGPKQDPPP